MSDVDPRPGNYYVSAIDAGHYWLVSGPYGMHADALRMLEPIKNSVIEQSPRSHFFAWGTCRLEDGAEAKPGLIQKRNGQKRALS